jgi:hypothetical protein
MLKFQSEHYFSTSIMKRWKLRVSWSRLSKALYPSYSNKDIGLIIEQGESHRFLSENYFRAVVKPKARDSNSKESGRCPEK